MGFSMDTFSVPANGITTSGLTAGSGPAVLLCHGFPETSLSWRPLIERLAAEGYRAIAPDGRGYGGTSAPEPVEAYSIFHLVGDAVGLLDALEIQAATIVGHDWGAQVAWSAALMRPDRFPAVVGMSVPYAPRASRHLLDAMRAADRPDFYMLHFQEPGLAEAELDPDPRRSLAAVYEGLSGTPSRPGGWDGAVGPGGFVASLGEPRGGLPWLPDAHLAESAAAFARTGFRGGLNWYRNMARDWALLAPFHGAPIRQPSLFIGGTADVVVRWNARTIAGFGRNLPGLVGSHLLPGIGHWVQQEAPEETARLVLAFLRRP